MTKDEASELIEHQRVAVFEALQIAPAKDTSKALDIEVLECEEQRALKFNAVVNTLVLRLKIGGTEYEIRYLVSTDEWEAISSS